MGNTSRRGLLVGILLSSIACGAPQDERSLPWEEENGPRSGPIQGTHTTPPEKNPPNLPETAPQPHVACKPGPQDVRSAYVFCGRDGQLGYGISPHGNQLMDFSTAGYRGGGVAFPTAVVMERVQKPSGEDDTARVQEAIDKVGELPLGPDGLRGAVLLGRGTYKLYGTVKLNHSGVVLRGWGSASGGTTFDPGPTAHTMLAVGGIGTWLPAKYTYDVTDKRVESGATVLHMQSTAGLHVGDTILINRPVMPTWLAYMGMDRLQRNGILQTWLKPGTNVSVDRLITAVDPGAIVLDAPVPDMLDTAYIVPGKINVATYTFVGRIRNVGVEHVRALTPAVALPAHPVSHLFAELKAVTDVWFNNVSVTNFEGGAISLANSTKRITLQDVAVYHAPTHGTVSATAADFVLGGTQALVVRGSSNSRTIPYVITTAEAPGPNVVLEFTTERGASKMAPMERWSTGLLLDNVNLPDGDVTYENRFTERTGDGWPMGFGVVYNSKMRSLTVQSAPGADNWAIGTRAPVPVRPDHPGDAGIIESPGVPVWPPSLYKEQLRQRLGDAALTALTPRLQP